jgi:3-deoxy-D-manno-octulosonate 8-phosphate phosphatase (KDO 8-P phosphatase)
VPQAEVGLEQALARLRLAVFDFDGVFTDNNVWVDANGVESVRCCRADGFGLRRLEEVGVPALILSTEVAPVVTARAEKLGVDCVQGIEEKLAVLEEAAAARGVALEDTAYVGNDVNDAPCLEAVGLPVVPADAWPEVRGLARWVLSRNGGEGCVREFCDAVWHARGGGGA